MQKKTLKSALSVVLCIVLIAAMALFVTGCSDKGTLNSELQSSNVEAQVVGEGKLQFDFTVIDKNGKESRFRVNTDKEKVGEALVELELISGDEGPYGLYVKTVNGQTLDFDKDGMYWAFYENGQYAASGVDTTKIKEGTQYTFKAEKG